MMPVLSRKLSIRQGLEGGGGSAGGSQGGNAYSKGSKFRGRGRGGGGKRGAKGGGSSGAKTQECQQCWGTVMSPHPSPPLDSYQWAPGMFEEASLIEFVKRHDVAPLLPLRWPDRPIRSSSHSARLRQRFKKKLLIWKIVGMISVINGLYRGRCEMLTSPSGCNDRRMKVTDARILAANRILQAAAAIANERRGLDLTGIQLIQDVKSQTSDASPQAVRATHLSEPLQTMRPGWNRINDELYGMFTKSRCYVDSALAPSRTLITVAGYIEYQFF